MPDHRIEVAAIVGSLRTQSYNRGLLRTARGRHQDVVEVFGGQATPGELGLAQAELGQPGVDLRDALAGPFGLCVTDEDELHGADSSG